MPERGELTKERFLVMAQLVGLDPKDPHMDDLFSEVQALFGVLRRLDELDVSDEEPALIFHAGQD